MSWDAERGKRLRKYREHDAVVNCLATCNQDLIASGSDDRSVKIYDHRAKQIVCSLACKFPVLTTSFAPSGDRLFTSGVEGTIRQWDLRQLSEEENRLEGTVQMTLSGHTDTVTGISLSPDGSSLLSTSMDHSCRIWDVRAFSKSAQQRNTAILYGARHNIDKNILRCAWSPSGKLVSSGSSDTPSCHVHIWEARTQQLVYKLPGHKGTVNEVNFHPKEPIVVSAGSDGVLFVGEIDSDLY
jgi:Prp8 binding protein